MKCKSCTAEITDDRVGWCEFCFAMMELGFVAPSNAKHQDMTIFTVDWRTCGFECECGYKVFVITEGNDCVLVRQIILHQAYVVYGDRYSKAASAGRIPSIMKGLNR